MDGKAEGFEVVTRVVDEVSMRRESQLKACGICMRQQSRSGIPLFFAPQTWHTRMVFRSPEELSRRSPQWVQNKTDPMALIARSQLK